MASFLTSGVGTAAGAAASAAGAEAWAKAGVAVAPITATLAASRTARTNLVRDMVLPGCKGDGGAGLSVVPSGAPGFRGMGLKRRRSVELPDVDRKSTRLNSRHITIS